MRNVRVNAAVCGIICLLLCCGLTSCDTSVDFQTPFGRQPGSQPGPWIILGVLSRSASTLSRPDGETTFAESTTVDVPPGTELIVPAVRGIVMGFGRTDPEDISSGSSFSWHHTDHKLGFSMVNVSVEDINAVDTTVTPPRQTATIRISAQLADDDANDPWFGGVNYTLICLGRHPS